VDYRFGALDVELADLDADGDEDFYFVLGETRELGLADVSARADWDRIYLSELACAGE
jgi:hypothetical protein